MNKLQPSAAAGRVLQAARCTRCQGHSFPAQVPGCRHCGAPRDQLEAVDCRAAVALRNFVTVHAPLAPGLPVPSVIGEVELCPGVVEEVLIDVPGEAHLSLGMPLMPAWSDAVPGGAWVFRPSESAVGEVAT
ncbi:hypothetical protein [Variovorax saccharolyticus]|uniref:hypothetical protein n=1 Tax=Variovorax saccharolyticus TaxID=3053516 RepID=UPI002576C6C8|nr:hypothetical protein [Variovorax sp. J31P216]MDM0025258.1 hypothetical protein [Variovorax sp. J31P216]